MAEESKIIATTRQTTGSADARRLRNTGEIPGVVYNEKAESEMIQLNVDDFGMMLRHHTSENLIVDMVLDGDKVKKVLLKEVQHDNVSGDILHVDFMEISMTKKMRSRIKLKLTGDCVGVEVGGGLLENLLREVEVECLPLDLVEEIDVDISNLNIGDSILVSDIVLDSKLIVLTPADITIASISAPRVEEAVAGEAAEDDKPSVADPDKK